MSGGDPCADCTAAAFVRQAHYMYENLPLPPHMHMCCCRQYPIGAMGRTAPLLIVQTQASLLRKAERRSQQVLRDLARMPGLTLNGDTPTQTQLREAIRSQTGSGTTRGSGKSGTIVRKATVTKSSAKAAVPGPNKKCPACQEPLKLTAVFCTQCGRKFEQ